MKTKPARIPLRRSPNGQSNETTIRLRIEALQEGGYVATSPVVPGLVAEGRSVTEAVEIAQGLTRKIIESCLEHGDPLPKSLAKLAGSPLNLVVPVGIRWWAGLRELPGCTAASHQRL